ncbi:MAG: Argininosuccinate synthase, partial [uncultured Gemmatimonadetes bacterium]
AGPPHAGPQGRPGPALRGPGVRGPLVDHRARRPVRAGGRDAAARHGRRAPQAVPRHPHGRWPHLALLPLRRALRHLWRGRRLQPGRRRRLHPPLRPPHARRRAEGPGSGTGL